MKVPPPRPIPSDPDLSAPSSRVGSLSLSRRRFMQAAAGSATAVALQPTASGRHFAAANLSTVDSPHRYSAADHKFPFDGSIFPFGAIHFSTFTHWQYYLQPIAEWRAWLERDLRQMKDLGLNTIVAHIDWYDAEPAQGAYDFSRSDVVVELAEKRVSTLSCGHCLSLSRTGCARPFRMLRSLPTTT